MKQQLVDVVVPPISAPLTYSVPEEMIGVEVGVRVVVPLGRREVSGFVVRKRFDFPELPSVARETSRQEFLIPSLETQRAAVKPILKAEDQISFDPAQLHFYERVAEYYGEAVSNVIDAAVPAFAPIKPKEILRLLAHPIASGRSQKREQLLKALNESPLGLELKAVRKRWTGITPVVQKLVQEGFVAIEFAEEESSVESAPEWAKKRVELTSEQSGAVNQIITDLRSKTFSTFLLQGVTGSGKTEVYIEAIRDALRSGGSALLVVPEISLTPQLIDRFRARLGSEIAVLHSALSRKTRWGSWRSLIKGTVRVAIGARSAIFAPLKDLSLIIVDEEHDSSFKQSEGFRYHGRDLAVLRGRFENCPVVLGSATPSLESYYHAKRGRYKHLRLSRKHGSGEKLSFELIDMSKIKSKELPRPNLSPRLVELLTDTILRDEQAFVLYNRRGFASYLQCDTCNTVKECRNCSVSLTYHQLKNMLVCHYCGYSAVPESYCSACRDESRLAAGKLLQRGAGTERVYDDLKSLLPEARIDRMDRDSATTPDDYRRILDRVRSGETQILVGTQMIAKGHDLPNVTLVGVVDCDVGLHFPDFRASERVFQLLTQVSGRAGRAEKPGRVVLQTRVPNHISLQKTIAHDYEGLALQLLQNRKELNYPPFVRLLRIVASSADEKIASQLLTELRDTAAAFIEARSLSLSLTGPAPAPLQKLKGLFRWHLIMRGSSATELNSVLRRLKEIKKNKDVRISFDMDPVDML